MTEIIFAQFGCGVTFHGQFQFFGAHAMTIITDRDQFPAALAHHHFDVAGPGIQCIFHQFLNGTGRTFDYLARSNLINSLFRKKSYFHGMESNCQGPALQAFIVTILSKDDLASDTLRTQSPDRFIRLHKDIFL